MNIIYYLLGSFVTLIGIIIYHFFKDNGIVVLNASSLTELGLTALIAGLAFFITDYLMSKKNG